MLSSIEKLFKAISAVALFSLMMVTLVDVVGRYVLNRPLPGATELTELGLAAVTMTMYPIIAFRNRHIVVDLFDPFFNGRVRSIQYAVSAVIGVGLFAIIAWRMWEIGMRSIGYGDTTGSLGIPLGQVLCAMAVMSGVTALAFAALLFDAAQFREPKNSITDGSGED